MEDDVSMDVHSENNASSADATENRRHAVVDNKNKLVSTPLHRKRTPSSQKSLKNINKLCYGTGGMPYQLTNTVIGFYIAIFLLDTALVKPQYASIIILLGRFWDAITDPLVGILITKTETRFGRLKPWMFCSAPFAAVCYVALWTVPDFNELGKFFYYMLTYCGFQTLLTCYHLPYTALTMLISEQQHERDSAVTFRMASEVVGNLLGNIIMGTSVQLFKRNVEQDDCFNLNTTANTSDVIKQERIGYQVGAATIGAIILCCAFTVLVGTTELNIKDGTEKDKGPLKKVIPRVLSFKPYFTLLGAFVFFLLAVQSIQGNFALYCKYTLEIDNYQNIIVAVLLSAFLLMPVWHFLMKRMGKKRALQFGATTTLPIIIVYAVLPPGYVWVLYAFSVLAGNAIAVVMLIPWSMVPDVIDDFLIKTSTSYETIFYSFFVMFLKFATGISLAMSTLILGLVGYETGQCNQPKGVSLTLRLLVTAFPCLCIFIGYVFLWFYPITEEVRQKNKTILEIWRDDRDARRRATVKKSHDQRIRTRSIRTASTTLL